MKCLLYNQSIQNCRLQTANGRDKTLRLNFSQELSYFFASSDSCRERHFAIPVERCPSEGVSFCPYESAAVQLSSSTRLQSLKKSKSPTSQQRLKVNTSSRCVFLQPAIRYDRRLMVLECSDLFHSRWQVQRLSHSSKASLISTETVRNGYPLTPQNRRSYAKNKTIN